MRRSGEVDGEEAGGVATTPIVLAVVTMDIAVTIAFNYQHDCYS